METYRGSGDKSLRISSLSNWKKVQWARIAMLLKRLWTHSIGANSHFVEAPLNPLLIDLLDGAGCFIPAETFKLVIREEKLYE
jgi:hypothetical protein